MKKGQLKHYRSYLNRLRNYSAANGIKVFKDVVPSEGIWHPSNRVIKIDEDMSQAEEIATFLHELGHAMDDLVVSYQSNEKMYKAYKAFDNNKYTPAQLKLVLECEQKAWDVGREIASRLHIRLGKWYDTSAKESVLAYKNG